MDSNEKNLKDQFSNSEQTQKQGSDFQCENGQMSNECNVNETSDKSSKEYIDAYVKRMLSKWDEEEKAKKLKRKRRIKVAAYALTFLLLLVSPFLIVKATEIYKFHVEKREGDMRVAKEMEKYFAAIRENDKKADAIIDSINIERSKNGLPIFDVRIRASLDNKGKRRNGDIILCPPEYWYFTQVESYGACYFEDDYKIMASGILFKLHHPNDKIPITVWRLINDYVGDSTPELWERFNVSIREKI